LLVCEFSLADCSKMIFTFWSALLAGADIKEMKDKQCKQFRMFAALFSSFIRAVADVYKNRFLETWTNITRLRKPLIAAVSGFAVSLMIIILN
jgi:enoyl-CoA hydratase/carnithine racemase